MTSGVQIEPYELLPWDSEHFGIRIGRVRGRRLDSARLRETLDWAHEAGIDCLYLLADGSHPETHRLAHRHGFRFVDVRLTLAAPVTAAAEPSPVPDVSVRAARPGDGPALQALGSGFRDSRFYADGRFEPSAVDALFERWLAGSLDGSLADRVLFAELQGEPAGYIAVRLDAAGRRGSVELVGTSPHARRRGIGRALVSSALWHFAQEGVESVNVVTQGRNTAAQRMYQDCGFRTQEVELWYHRWSDEQN